MHRKAHRWYGWLLTSVLAAMLLAPVATTVAQDATPDASPTGAGETIVSLTREEYMADLAADLGYTEPEQQGGTYITAENGDIQGLNPLLAEETTTSTVLGYIYDTLVGTDPRTGEPSPDGLADSWEIAPDGKTYTFHLNPNATWHDGQPVTSADVIFSLDALANPGTASAYTGVFNDSVASYQAIDDYTVEIVTNEPYFDFLYSLALYIVPQHIWGDIPFTDWKEHPISTGQDQSQVIGSGPFRLVEWIPGESLRLARNDEYFGKVPYIDEFVMQIRPDQTSAVNALINDEIDVLDLEPGNVAEVEGLPNVEIVTFDRSSFSYLGFNLNQEMTTLFQDPAVRQALYFAFDREAIANDILLGYATAAQGTQPIISPAYAPEEATITYNYDPDRARELLAEAGWEDTNGDGTVDKDGQELAFELIYASGSPGNDQVVAYLQDAWSQIGVSATPRALEFAALIEAITTDTVWEMVFIGFIWDATFIQEAMFGCDQYRVGFNDMMYCNEEVDELNRQARLEFDEAARRDLLIAASNLINQDLPIMVTTFGKGIVAYNTRIHNYIPGPWGIPINYVWISQ
jgi:peptide/nickel transport system substrate-binding protein